MTQWGCAAARCQARRGAVPNLPFPSGMSDPNRGPSTADHIGEAAGGITGVVAGAAIGVTAGPLGVLLGGIAGAIGGWWTGRALVEAAEDITEADEAFYREDFEHVPHGG